MKSVWKRLLTLALLALPFAALAEEAPSLAQDPEIEARMLKLSEELRCVVCQNETLAGSRAELAEDLRQEIRDQMKTGKTDPEVIEYLTARYGDFVLYRPPLKPLTLLLWFGPLLFISVAGVAWYLTLRRRRATSPAVVAEDKLREAARLLAENEGKDKA